MRFSKRIIAFCALALTAACGGPEANNAVVAANLSSVQTNAEMSTNAAAVASVSPLVSASTATTDDPAARVIRKYYDAINAHDFRKAYALWDGDGRSSRQAFEQFSGGFGETAETKVEIGQASDLEGAAGSQYITFPVEVNSKLKDGSKEHFKSEYVLRRSLVEGAERRGEWRIYSARIRKL